MYRQIIIETSDWKYDNQVESLVDALDALFKTDRNKCGVNQLYGLIEKHFKELLDISWDAIEWAPSTLLSEYKCRGVVVTVGSASGEVNRMGWYEFCAEHAIAAVHRILSTADPTDLTDKIRQAKLGLEGPSAQRSGSIYTMEAKSLSKLHEEIKLLLIDLCSDLGLKENLFEVAR